MMDNLQTWIYIILGLVYFISRLRKKPEEPVAPPRRQAGQREGDSAPKPLTFEELLREITEAKEPYTTAPTTSKPVQEFVDYDDEIEEEKEPERPDYDYKKQETYQVFEENRFAAFNRVSYEDTLKVEDTKVDFGKFKAFEEEKGASLASQIAEDFTDADKVKRAFIMSEIFNRKYA